MQPLEFDSTFWKSRLAKVLIITGFTALFTWMSIVLVLATIVIYAWTYIYSSLTHEAPIRTQL